MTRKTKLMLEVEQRVGQPFEKLLPRMLAELGMRETARELGVSPATVGYWMLKLGIQVQRVAVPPGTQVIIKRAA